MSGVGVLDKAVVILAACVDGASLAELVERTKFCRGVYSPVAAGPASSWWQISSVKTAVNSMKTIACTSPTSSSMK